MYLGLAIAALAFMARMAAMTTACSAITVEKQKFCYKRNNDMALMHYPHGATCSVALRGLSAKPIGHQTQNLKQHLCPRLRRIRRAVVLRRHFDHIAAHYLNTCKATQ